MSKRKQMWTGVIASVVMFAMFFGGAARAETVDFKLPGLDGREVRLSDFRGKWVVVNYWATWCPPCREELPELEVFHDNHKDKDAVVIGVNMERARDETLREFVEAYFISYPIVRAEPAPRTELGSVPGLPTTYIVSPEGEVVARHVGPLTADALEKYIERKRAEAGTE